MFEHLDDPRPYEPPARLRAAVHRRVRQRRRRRVAVAGGVASVVALGVGATSIARDRVTPDQIDVAGLPPEEERPQPGEPMTLLLVGVDGTGDPEQGRSGLTDTIVVAHVDPEAGELRLLVVPRDLEVDGRPGVRINSLRATGGAEALITGLTAQLGVAIDHYAEVDFAGFREGVDTLGGLRVSVPGAVRAETTGLELAAGCQTIDGDEALALARSRRDVEHQGPDGRWSVDVSGDYGRQDRVGVLAVALLRAVADVGPGDLPRLVRDGIDGIVVDQHLDVDAIVALARQAGTARVVPLRLPVTEAPPGGPAVLHLADGADAVLDQLDGAPPPPDAPPPGPPVGPGEAPVGDATGLAAC